MGLRVLCANVNNSNPLTHAILNDDKSPASTLDNTDVIVITEPWIRTIRPATNEKGTVNHPNWKCHLPSAPIGEARVVVYIRKRSNLMSHITRGRGDLIPIKITLPNNAHLSLLAVYNPPSTAAATEFISSTDLPPEPTLLVGDFNLHSPGWDDAVTVENDRAHRFCEWMANNNIKVNNDSDKPTYHGHRFQHASVIDLALTNSLLSFAFDISHVKVHTDDHYGGDHYPISIGIHPVQNQGQKNDLDSPDRLPTLRDEKKKTGSRLLHLNCLP